MAIENISDSRKKSLKRTWRSRLLINALALFVIIIILRSFDHQKQFNRAICYEKQNMETSYFHLTVSDKYKDSLNHNYNTIKYFDLNKMKENKMYIINEIGGFYNAIHIGDTLLKNGGDLKVCSINRDTTYLLIYNCRGNYKKQE